MIIRKIVILIFAWWCFSFHAYAQTHREIVVKSAKCDCGELLSDVSYTANQSGLDDSTSVFYVLRAFQQEGYVFARIDSILFVGEKTEVWVAPGSKYVWENLRVGNDIEVALQSPANGFKEKEAFVPEKLTAVAETVIRYYENNGYPFVRVRLDSVEIDSNTVSAVINAVKGKFVKLDTVIVDADFEISPYYIYNVTGLHPGDIYIQKKIDDAEKTLRSGDFFTLNKSSSVLFKGNSAMVRIKLLKRKVNTFDGIVGFYSENRTGKIAFNGNINLKLINSFGTGETFKINWNRPVAGNQTLNLSYSQPYLFKSLFGLDFSFDLYKQDSSFLNLTNNVSVPYRFTPDKYLTLTGTYFSSQISAGNRDTTLTGFHSATFGLGLVYNTLDYKYNPRRGMDISVLIEAGNKIVQNNDFHSEKEVSSRAMISFSGKWFMPVFRQSTFLISAETSALFSPSVYGNELYRIGGLKSLRGFDEQSIRASSYAIIDLEYRLLYSRNSALSLFYNAAWVEKKLASGYFSDIPTGFGAGFSLDTGSGIISLFYALGKQQGNMLSFKESKIHFGYLVRF